MVSARSSRPSSRYIPICVLLMMIAFLGFGAYRYVHQRVLGASTRQLPVKKTMTPDWRVAAQPWPLHNASRPLDITTIQATSLILVDEDTATILAARQPDTRRSMASLTKIMTAALALEFTDPNSQVTIPAAALDNLPGDSALMGITPGERYTIKELLDGALLESGNDAAQALALAVSGSQKQFISLMNAKAKQLALTNTHFADAAGLDAPQHYSTARDLAMLAHYARSFPLFDTIVATPSITLPYSTSHKELYLENLNAFISSYPGATGIKPGNTGAAGNCLIASAERNGHHLIGVLLDTPGRNTNMAKLFDLGFASFQ